MTAKNKATYLEASYEIALTWDLEELEIEWGNVEDYYIKYGELNITFKDGSNDSYMADHSEPDFKWSQSEKLLTRDWSLIEELG